MKSSFASSVLQPVVLTCMQKNTTADCTTAVGCMMPLGARCCVAQSAWSLWLKLAALESSINNAIPSTAPAVSTAQRGPALAKGIKKV